jgi:hypothetical protein
MINCQNNYFKQYWIFYWLYYIYFYKIIILFLFITSPLGLRFLFTYGEVYNINIILKLILLPQLLLLLLLMMITTTTISVKIII